MAEITVAVSVTVAGGPSVEITRSANITTRPIDPTIRAWTEQAIGAVNGMFPAPGVDNEED